MASSRLPGPREVPSSSASVRSGRGSRVPRRSDTSTSAQAPYQPVTSQDVVLYSDANSVDEDFVATLNPSVFVVPVEKGGYRALSYSFDFPKSTDDAVAHSLFRELSTAVDTAVDRYKAKHPDKASELQNRQDDPQKFDSAQLLTAWNKMLEHSVDTLRDTKFRGRYKLVMGADGCVRDW